MRATAAALAGNSAGLRPRTLARLRPIGVSHLLSLAVHPALMSKMSLMPELLINRFLGVGQVLLVGLVAALALVAIELVRFGSVPFRHVGRGVTALAVAFAHLTVLGVTGFANFLPIRMHGLSPCLAPAEQTPALAWLRFSVARAVRARLRLQGQEAEGDAGH